MNKFWQYIKGFLSFAKEAAPLAADVAKIAGADKGVIDDIGKASQAAAKADAAVNKER